MPNFPIQRCLCILVCMWWSMLAGCMVIPTPEHGLLQGRGKIEPTDTAFLQEAETTREEVVLRFGEPDMVLDHDRILIYHWAVSHGYWFAGGYYTAAGGPIPKEYLLMIEFDDQGLLKRFESTGSIWTSAQSRIEQCAPADIQVSTREVILIDPAPEARGMPPGTQRPGPPVRFRMGELRPLGTSLVGHKIGAFGVIVADVHTCRPPIDMVRAVVAARLQAAGHLLVDHDPDVIVSGDLARFEATTAVDLSSWEAVGSLEVRLKVVFPSRPRDPLTRRYQAHHVSKTILGPSAENFEQVLRACLQDFQRQVGSDEKLAAVLVNCWGRCSVNCWGRCSENN